MQSHRLQPLLGTAPAQMVRVERSTGREAGPPVPIHWQDMPYRLPVGSDEMWRFIELRYFEDLLVSESVYLTRVDKFVDQLEGKYSEHSIHGTSRTDRDSNRVYPTVDNYDELSGSQEHARRNTFACCWHVSHKESDRMWLDKPPESVAVRTTWAALRQFVPPGVIASKVKYIPANFPRTNFDNRSLFFFKNEDFKYERELRLVLPVWENTVGPNDVGRRLHVDPSSLVKGVVLHPLAPQHVREETHELLAEHLPGCLLKESRFQSRFRRQSPTA